jgi:hypothetical protein
LLYLACSGTPYCDSFPGSTLAIGYIGGYYEYYVTDARKLGQTGDGDMTGLQYYGDPIELLSYPMGFGTVAVDTVASYNPTHADYTYGVDTLKGDAWGTLTLPSGTYANVLRVHIALINNDSDLSSGAPVVTRNRQDLYMWWTAGFHNPLLLMTYDTTGGASYLSGVAYYTKPVVLLPTVVQGINSNMEGLTIYPNPAVGSVHIQYSSPDRQVVTISLTDMIGRTIGAPSTENFLPSARRYLFDANANFDKFLRQENTSKQLDIASGFDFFKVPERNAPASS